MRFKILLLLAGVGHIICGITDYLFSYTPNGKLSWAAMKDYEQMNKLFAGMSLNRIKYGMLLGVIALIMEFFWYLKLCTWVSDSAEIHGIII